MGKIKAKKAFATSVRIRQINTIEREYLTV